MKIKISTLAVTIILIITTIIGVTFLLQPKKLTEQENLNEVAPQNVGSKLDEKIDTDLLKQDKEFKEKIDMYISKIYSTADTYLEEFEDINSANELWIWECAHHNLANFEELHSEITVTKENVEMSAKQLFGNGLQKEFPKQGIEFWLEPVENGYFYAAASIESDFHNDYEILEYKKNGNKITVDIVEYKYNGIFLGEPTELNLYKINSDEIIKNYPLEVDFTSDNINDYLVSKHGEATEFIKENPELFSTATINLEYDKQNDLLYIKAFERDK